MRAITSLPIALLVLPALACSKATGTLSGGEAEIVDPCAADGGDPTWQNLYACDFGPLAGACGTVGCHGTMTDPGTADGFFCGPTADTCFQGMKNGLYGTAPLVPAGVISDPTTTLLWDALRKAGSTPSVTNLNNMPELPTSYFFSQDDLSRIATWMESGAQNDEIGAEDGAAPDDAAQDAAVPETDASGIDADATVLDANATTARDADAAMVQDDADAGARND